MSKKKLQAGEFIEWAGVRLQLIGFARTGLIVGENENGYVHVGIDPGDTEHLPDCTGFDWQPETFPQWYAKACGTPYADCDHIIRMSKDTLCGVLTDGTKTKEVPWEKYHEEFVVEGSWVPLTQAEAEDRIKKQEPINLINLMNCPDCGEFRGHGHEEICKATPKTEVKPEMSSRELEFLEIVAKQRDTIDKLAKRVEKLEQAAIPYQTIGGSLR